MASKLKKRPDTAALARAGAAAVAGGSTQTPADPIKTPTTPTPGPKKRGRKPGTRFDGGYQKRNRTTPPDPAHQENSTDGAEDPGTHDAGDAGAAGFPAGANMTDMVAKLVDVGFNIVLAPRRGEHWHMEPAEVDALSAPIAEMVQELVPQFAESKWGLRLGVIALILGPKILADVMKHHPKILSTFQKPRHHEQHRSPDPDQTQYPSDSRPAGAGEDVTRQDDPPPADQVGSN